MVHHPRNTNNYGLKDVLWHVADIEARRVGQMPEWREGICSSCITSFVLREGGGDIIGWGYI